jgi:hypothetical protein
MSVSEASVSLIDSETNASSSPSSPRTDDAFNSVSQSATVDAVPPPASLQQPTLSSSSSTSPPASTYSVSLLDESDTTPADAAASSVEIDSSSSSSSTSSTATPIESSEADGSDPALRQVCPQLSSNSFDFFMLWEIGFLIAVVSC